MAYANQKKKKYPAEIDKTITLEERTVTVLSSIQSRGS
jgi:hypothetical protein